MKRITTIREFTENYLEPTQHIYVEDLESDYIYFEGQARELLALDDIIISGRLVAIHENVGLKSKNGIVLYI